MIRNLTILFSAIALLVFAPVLQAQDATREDNVGGTNINRGAEEGRSQQSGGSGMNAAVAAALAIPCATVKPPGNIPFCIMSMLAAMQSGHDGGAAGQSAGVEIDTNFATGGSGEDGATDGNRNPRLPGGVKASLAKSNEVKGKLAELGYSYDPNSNSVGLPDGSSIPASAANSPQSMSAFGLDGAAAAEAFDLAQKTAEKEADFNVVAMETGGGGGGAGGGGGSSSYDFDSDFDSLMKKYRRKPAATAKGFTRKLAGGGAIGVSQDNIFDMVHRKYQGKRKTQIFIEKIRKKL